MTQQRDEFWERKIAMGTAQSESCLIMKIKTKQMEQVKLLHCLDLRKRSKKKSEGWIFDSI